MVSTSASNLAAGGGAVAPDVLDAVLEQNARARAELLDAIDALPAARRGEASLDGWSVQEIVAHIAAAQDGRAQALEMIARGEAPHVGAFAQGDPAAFLAALRADAVSERWEQVLGRLRFARERHEAAVRGLGVLEPERYAPGRIAHRVADVAPFDVERAERIRAWRREQGL
jgi:DinB family protein